MRAYLSLGSNLGDKTANLVLGIRGIAALQGVRLNRVSSFYKTRPWGYIEQPSFVNAAAAVTTDLDPVALLDDLQAVERGLGRVPGTRWSSRVFDADIVLMDELQVESERLCIPHRLFRERAFVLIPLAEIAAEVVDPVSGRAIGELAGLFGNDAGLVKIGTYEDFALKV
ncbi:MAG: 2-amino-4-hydroxy-6-hydroxymethyldihydropteridine diphosphokinase [Candidatus Hydrogenedentota bacterium]